MALYSWGTGTGTGRVGGRTGSTWERTMKVLGQFPAGRVVSRWQNRIQLGVKLTEQDSAGRLERER